MEQEIWKVIPNSKGYAVSNTGKVKRLAHKQWNSHNNSYSSKKEKPLFVCYNNTKKYGRILIKYLDESTKVCGIHRLVAECFIENPNNLAQVNHIDGDKTNNNATNLEWCSQEQNMQHRINTLGIKPWSNGADCNFAKISEEQVRMIPVLLQEGKTKRKIAEILGVVPSTITEITSGRSWKHLNLF